MQSNTTLKPAFNDIELIKRKRVAMRHTYFRMVDNTRILVKSRDIVDQIAYSL